MSDSARKEGGEVFASIAGIDPEAFARTRVGKTVRRMQAPRLSPQGENRLRALSKAWDEYQRHRNDQPRGLGVEWVNAADFTRRMFVAKRGRLRRYMRECGATREQRATFWEAVYLCAKLRSVDLETPGEGRAVKRALTAIEQADPRR